ncbi:MAG: SurA N-terminal domain-containing protein [Bdellovibrio sp.]|nr:SurA N-terminal domain-containing protein [Bdellovibrio sp.]
MLEWIRAKFGRVIISIIIGFIAFVFAFYGIFRPKSTRGLHQGAVAGIVNGDAISLAEFNRALNQRLEFFKKIAGDKITEEQLKAFHIKESVFNELVNRKLMTQEAKKLGFIASKEEMREKIQELNVFQKDGRFDFGLYKAVLEANRYTPSGFERMMQEDLSLQSLNDYLKNNVHASDSELKTEFVNDHNRRNIKYVLFTPEAARKVIKINPEEVKKFLEDSKKMNLAKTQYDSKKEKDYKNISFDLVKEKIAEEILASGKTEEIQKLNNQLADQVIGLLKPDPKLPDKEPVSAKKEKAPAKKINKEDEKINALLKQYNIEVQRTGLIKRDAPYIPAIGMATSLLADAFNKDSILEPSKGGSAKKYQLPTGTLVAIVSESENPDLSKLDAEKQELTRKITYKKLQALNQAFLKKLHTKAKIEKNPQVVEDKEDHTTDVPYDGG